MRVTLLSWHASTTTWPTRSAIRRSVKIPRLNKGISATVLVKMESFNPARIGERPHRRCDDRGRGARRASSARNDDPRADERKYRHRAGVRCRGERLSDYLGYARYDDDRAAQPAQSVRRASRADPRRGGDAGRRSRARPRSRPARRASISYRSSLRIRRTRRSIAARRPKRFGAIPTARSMSVVSAVGTGGTITGVGRGAQAA